MVILLFTLLTIYKKNKACSSEQPFSLRKNIQLYKEKKRKEKKRKEKKRKEKKRKEKKRNSDGYNLSVTGNCHIPASDFPNEIGLSRTAPEKQDVFLFPSGYEKYFYIKKKKLSRKFSCRF